MAALTLTPSYHNFGKVVAGNQASREFTTILPPGAARGISLTYSITGPNATDFQWETANPVDPFNSNTCQAGPQGVACTGSVLFYPRSIGPKRATLAVADGRGSMTSATLEGEGVAALCTNRVVFCNYALHYSGVVSWQGGDGHANVDVVAGVASCNAATADGNGMTSGPGLIAVEFGQDDEMPAGFYRITAACPIHYVSEPGYPPVPDRPAELGHDELGSYKQPLPYLRRDHRYMSIAEVQAGPPRLKGSDGEVSWDLCPNSQYQVATLQPAREASRPICTP